MPSSAACAATSRAYSAKPDGVQRLRAVAERGLGVLGDLDDDAVGADRGGRARQRLDQAPVARRVRRVDDHRQVRVELEPRHRAEVEREARGGLERADPALAQDHLLVALLEDVVGRLQQLVQRRRQPALEQHRLAELAGDLEQRVVLHVARADLDDVGVLVDHVGVLGVEQLGHDRQAGLARAPRPGSRAPATPRPLNANGDVRGLNAPPRSIAAPRGLDRVARPSSVCSRDSTVHGPAIRQNVSAAADPCGRRPRTTVGSWWLSSLDASLYGREIGTTRSTPGIPSRPSSRDALRIADRADRRRQLAGHHDHVHARRLEALRDGVDLGLRGLGCHHDHHGAEKRT